MLDSCQIYRLRGSSSWLRGFLVLVTFVASGCSMLYLDVRQLPRSPGSAAKPLGAVLVGTVTNPDPHTPGHLDVTFRFASADGKRRFNLSNASPHWWVHGDEAWADHGLKSVNGKLFAVPVIPGDYELHSVYIYAQFSKQAEFVPSPRFSIDSDEVLYIGSFEVTSCYSVYVTPDGRRVREAVVGGLPAVQDRSERDIPLLRDTFPDLRVAHFVTRVVDNDAVPEQARERLSRSCSYERELKS